MVMRTVREWLNLLPEPHRTKALEAMYEELADMEVKTMSHAIFRVDWSSGIEYWGDLYKAAVRGDFSNIDSQPISSWLKKLPEPFRSQALYNFKSQGRPDFNTNSANEAINTAFRWNATPEGFEYWSDFQRCVVDDNLPPDEVDEIKFNDDDYLDILSSGIFLER